LIDNLHPLGSTRYGFGIRPQPSAGNPTLDTSFHSWEVDVDPEVDREDDLSSRGSARSLSFDNQLVEVWNARLHGNCHGWHGLTISASELYAAVVEEGPAARGAFENFWRRFRHDYVGLTCLGFLALFVLAATIGAPLVAALTAHGVIQQFPAGMTMDGFPLPPWSHALTSTDAQDPNGPFFILGTDRLGRDVLVRLLYGARISLIVALAATGGALLIGVPLGLCAGYFGGKFDTVVGRAVEIAMAFPSMLFAIGLAAVIGPGLLNVIFVIILFSWYYPARMVRSAVVALKGEPFIEAAVSVGSGHRRIMFRHLLPQLTAPLIVYATGIIAANVLFEAGLSFLGLGVPLPTPSWGQMLSEGVAEGLYRIAPWAAIVPGIALVLTTLALNQLGDSLRDALAPRGRG